MGKRNGGFSLIETLVSIVILGAMVVPTCTALVMTVKLNDKTEKMLQAQLAVSSAVETLMAEGINGSVDSERFSDVTVTVTEVKENDIVMPYFTVVVTSTEEPEVAVTTTIRAADETPDLTGGDS